MYFHVDRALSNCELLCVPSSPLPSDTLAKFYQPWAFLMQASDLAVNQRLYSNMLQDLEPMNFLPFDLSIDFEIKQVHLFIPLICLV